MKNFINLMLAFSVLMSACKKDNPPPEPSSAEKKVNVRFFVDNFSQTVEKFNSAKVSADSIGKAPGALYVRFYNLDQVDEYGEPGILTTADVHFSSSSNYDIINTQLPQGNYVAFFISSNSLFSQYFGLGSGLANEKYLNDCLLYTSPSPRDRQKSRMPSSA